MKPTTSDFDRGRRWALVLAAGEGTRLRSLTTTRQGVIVPKQYCSLNGGASLLTGALERAARVVPRDRTVAIVAGQHRRWWDRELAQLPSPNVIVQPENRGTAAGVLLPLLSILERDPEARVAILPSDHFVTDERVLAAELGRAFEALEHDPARVVLLGIDPDAADPDYGWIVPGPPRRDGLHAVDAFVEKPQPPLAAELRGRGGVWNSFILVASGPALLRLYAERLPALLDAFDDRGSCTLEQLYALLPVWDFSRDLMQGSEERLSLLRVPPCGWSDLGTPERVAGCVGRRSWTPLRRSAPLDLALALAAF